MVPAPESTRDDTSEGGRSGPEFGTVTGVDPGRRTTMQTLDVEGSGGDVTIHELESE